MSTAIKVENLSKRYLINHQKQAKLETLADRVIDGSRGFYKRLKSPFKSNVAANNREEFWALQDINLEIQQGDRVGIIGRNGAGKSTLLKILSRITAPTTGKITIEGRVASLLEVGTGFHSELTGRENIFLNGAVLGMRKHEIVKKFDEIVAFAEVEKFLDTPVKRYSSGMYVRLAFAVAAHLESEILIVDEVLAVGDVEFQKKCLGKMDDVSRLGRTTIFVSHNMAAVRKLCNKGINLSKGNTVFQGSISESIETYLLFESSINEWKNSSVPDELNFIKKISIRGDSEGKKTDDLQFSDEINIFILVNNYNSLTDWLVRIELKNYFGEVAFVSWDIDYINPVAHSKISESIFLCRVPRKLMNPGSYFLSVAIYDRLQQVYTEKHDDVVNFKISDLYYDFNKGRPGIISPLLKWEIL